MMTEDERKLILEAERLGEVVKYLRYDMPLLPEDSPRRSAAYEEAVKIKAERDRYREALEWYADPESWVLDGKPKGYQSQVDHDQGKRARKILEEE